VKTTFITWYPSCRRSDALANALGGVSHLIHYLAFKQPLCAPLKYVLQSVATWRLLWRDRPGLILVASPPVFAVLIVWCYARLCNIPYVMDAHTGVFDDARWTCLLPLSRFLARQAAGTIVTNTYLKAQVEDWGARAIVIGDVPVAFPDVAPAALGTGPHVVVINTFSQDEPLDELLMAAAALPEVQFHITGSVRHARRLWSVTPPPQVRFTEWLSDEDYTALLRAADVVITLTTQDHTMQRGGYEAMALEKPLITSNWGVLRETFYLGTVHTANTAKAIAEAVTLALLERPRLAAEMRQLRCERLDHFADTLRTLQALLAQQATP
jgi:glycosyltransferase involved in cell wall biosynthesis